LYHVSERFEIDDLDPEDPFEVDSLNLPHLFKHLIQADGRPVRVDLGDVRLLYVWGAVLYYPADFTKGSAHWIMCGEIDGIVVSVALAPAKSGDPQKCRPIGLNKASAEESKRYLEDR
jgi:hypothetical protein